MISETLHSAVGGSTRLITADTMRQFRGHRVVDPVISSQGRDLESDEVLEVVVLLSKLIR